MPNWAEYGALISQVCNAKRENPKGVLRRGQVVVVPRTGFDVPKYGIVAQKNKNNSYEILVEKDLTSKTLKPNHIIVVSDDVLSEQSKQVAPLENSEKLLLEREMKSNREQLQEILDLFDTVKPLNFTDEEKELIENPFPIVWASLSLEPKAQVGTDFAGEQKVTGKAVLGDDIQVVFTNQENVEKLRSLVQEHGVQVYNFEAAYYLLGKEEKKYPYLPKH